MVDVTPEQSEAIHALTGLVGKFLELGGRAAEGVFSTPWTGVPFTLIILAQVDPSGKLTAQFLANLASFLTAIGTMLGKVVEDGINTFNNTIVPPPPTFTTGAGVYGFIVDVPAITRALFNLGLVPGGALIPRTEFRYNTAALRDAGEADFKNRAGILSSIYTYTEISP